ncbi:MAG: hypothetical protein ACE366_01680 [Bradymonadia bacterium]
MLTLTGLLASCLTQRDGITVDVSLQHQSARITHPQGSLEISNLGLTIWSTALVRCTPEETSGGALRWLIGTAHAHSASDPTRSGVPVVSDVAHLPETGAALAMLSPPPGRWCTLEVTLAPADADAVGLDDHTHMEGRTFDLDGTLRTSADESISVRVLGAAQSTISLPLGPLELSDATDHVHIAVGLDLEAWLAEVDLLDDDAAARSRQLFTGLSNHIQLEVRTP